MNAHDVERLFKSHRRALFAWAYQRIKNYEDVEDAVARAITVACQNVSRYKGPEGVDGSGAQIGWLYCVLRNVCREDVRKMIQEQGRSTSFEEAEGLDELIAEERQDWVSAELAHEARYRLRHADLSEVQREVLTLRLEGLSIKDIAEQTQRKQDAIIKTLQRAMSILRRCPMKAQEEALDSAGYVFYIGSKVSTYRAPTTNGSGLANERLRRLN